MSAERVLVDAKRRNVALVATLLLWLMLATPWARTWLEASMARHMLLQLSVLVGIGVALWSCLRAPARATRWHALWHRSMRGGAAGLLFAAFVLTLWMLPRLLDASVLDARYEFAKFVLLPAAGLAIASAWGRCPPLGRLVVHIEVIATLLRFGWGYIEAPDRLCAVYLLDEQQDVGIALLILGCIYALAASWRALFGGPSLSKTSTTTTTARFESRAVQEGAGDA